jgi:putative transposase
MTLDETIAHLPKTGLSVGIDLGLTNMVTLSTGEQFESPRYLQQASRKLRSEQKALSRCKKGSNGYARQRDIVARLHAKVAACRKDFADKLTTDLVRRFDVIAIENLNIKGMMKNRRLAKSCSDVSMGQIRRMLEYKTAMYGKTLLVVDRFFPSSKMCSACGHVHKEMPLKVRKFICEGCGKEWDRDINAAINILANGKPVGERVKPAKVARKPRSAEDKSPILICAADLLVPAGAAEVVEAACAAE